MEQSNERKASVLVTDKELIQDEMDLAIAGVDGIDQVPEIVDPETGEVLNAPVDVPDDMSDEQFLASQALPQFARILNAIDRRENLLKGYREIEIDRIKISCQAKLDQLEKSRSAMLRQARHIVERALPKKPDGTFRSKSLDYPGLGMFSLRSETPALNETEWNSMDQVKKGLALESHPGLFSMDIKPDRKAIRKKLDDGDAVPGFQLSTDPVQNYVNYKRKG